MRNWMLQILDRPWQSALAVFVLTIFPLLNVLASPLLGLITLRNGLQVGLLALCGGIAGTGLIAYFEFGHSLFQSYGVLLLQLAGDFALVMIAALILRRVVSLSLALYFTALLLCAFAIGLHLFHDLPDATVWHNFYLQQQALFGPNNADQSIMGFDQDKLLLLFTIVAKSWMGVLFLATVLKLFLARWWQARLYNPGGFQQAFHSLRLSPLILLSLMPFLIGGLIAQSPLWLSVLPGTSGNS